MPVGKLTDDWYFVCGVDVLAPRETGGIVAFGDSLTDANISTMDAFCRWPDQLSRPLHAPSGRRPLGALNRGHRGTPLLDHSSGTSGDHLHPSDLGYNTMGDAIDLSLFE